MDILTIFSVKCYKNVDRRQWGWRKNTEIWWLCHKWQACLKLFEGLVTQWESRQFSSGEGHFKEKIDSCETEGERQREVFNL
jgi:hypothetical protein